MFSSQILRNMEPPAPFPQFKPPTYAEMNPYKAKRLWPPDFSKLSEKHQFRLERKYKRRMKLKWARPGWNKGIEIAQIMSIAFVGVYGVFFAEWNQPSEPFHALRQKLRDTFGDQRERKSDA